MVKEVQKKPENPWSMIRQHYEKQPLEGMPKITVVVPTFNQAHVLKDTLENVFKQRNVDKEIIIVDAGSTDTTYSYLQQNEDKIRRIYFVTKYNLPLMINKGISLATGQYVCFLFPGYQYHNPYSLCQIARVALENHMPDFIYSAENHGHEVIKDYGRSIKAPLAQLQPTFTLYPFSPAYLKRGFLPTSPFCMWFRADSFKEMGQFNYNYSFSKSVFDYLCRLQKKKDMHVATTYWTICSSNSSDKYVVTMLSLFERLLLIVKYYGPIEGLLWFVRDKPIHLFAWLFRTLRNVFSPK